MYNGINWQYLKFMSVNSTSSEHQRQETLCAKYIYNSRVLSTTVFRCSKKELPMWKPHPPDGAVCPSVRHLVSAAKTSDRYLSHLVQEFVLEKLVFRENRLRSCLSLFDLLIFAIVFFQIRQKLITTDIHKKSIVSFF